MLQIAPRQKKVQDKNEAVDLRDDDSWIVRMGFQWKKFVNSDVQRAILETPPCLNAKLE